MSKGGSTTNTTEIPEWLENAAIENINKGRAVSNIGYTPYYGPEVAAFNPMQASSFRATGSAADAFGLGPASTVPSGASFGPHSPTWATDGMPEAQTFAGGIQGYSSAPMYEEALSQLQQNRPAQYNAINNMFLDPITGASPTGSYAASPEQVEQMFDRTPASTPVAAAVANPAVVPTTNTYNTIYNQASSSDLTGGDTFTGADGNTYTVGNGDGEVDSGLANAAAAAAAAAVVDSTGTGANGTLTVGDSFTGADGSTNVVGGGDGEVDSGLANGLLTLLGSANANTGMTNGIPVDTLSNDDAAPALSLSLLDTILSADGSPDTLSQAEMINNGLVGGSSVWTDSSGSPVLDSSGNTVKTSHNNITSGGGNSSNTIDLINAGDNGAYSGISNTDAASGIVGNLVDSSLYGQIYEGLTGDPLAGGSPNAVVSELSNDIVPNLTLAEQYALYGAGNNSNAVTSDSAVTKPYGSDEIITLINDTNANSVIPATAINTSGTSSGLFNGLSSDQLNSEYDLQTGIIDEGLLNLGTSVSEGYVDVAAENEAIEAESQRLLAESSLINAELKRQLEVDQKADLGNLFSKYLGRDIQDAGTSGYLGMLADGSKTMKDIEADLAWLKSKGGENWDRPPSSSGNSKNTATFTGGGGTSNAAMGAGTAKTGFNFGL
tara:strand:+ start:5710 stop:7704 length:1995 start_codon:yes stop_codon:yes gene_type:complete